MKRTLPLFALLFLGAFGLGSSISCDAVDEAFDCSQVCGRYRDCYDSSYDVDGCESRCRTNAANDPNVRGRRRQLRILHRRQVLRLGHVQLRRQLRFDRPLTPPALCDG